MASPERDAVAFVLKGYPRRSELFIASEIWRLEQLGVPLRLFVLRPPDEIDHHAVVDRVRTVPSYLPRTTSMRAEPFVAWLRHNARPFLPAAARMVRRHPWRTGRAAAASLAQAWRARLGWRPKSTYAKELLQALEVADRVERAGDVAHLHAHFAHGATTVTWLASMITGLPFSFTGHAKDIWRPALNPAGLLGRKLRAARFAVTCTGSNAVHLRAHAGDTPVHVVYHGLNADFARLLDGGDGGQDDPADRPVVSVGRLVEKKGFDTLVEAIAVLRGRGHDERLEIAGESGEAERIVRRRIDELGLARAVQLLGPLDQPGLLRLYRRAAVVVLACRIADDGDRDGIPNVLVEAMAAGAPVVATTVSGIPELVTDGLDGLLVEPDDADALAAAIERVLTDGALARRLGAAARRTVADRFDGDALARVMAGLLSGCPR